jgi:hypothetical protein
MRTLQKGDVIQLERKGYHIVDVPLIRASQPLVLFAIPDGHQKKPAVQLPAAAHTAASAAAPARDAPKKKTRAAECAAFFFGLQALGVISTGHTLGILKPRASISEESAVGLTCPNSF